jgi:hypothetical protein
MTQAEFDTYANRRLTDEDIAQLRTEMNKETDGCNAEAISTLIMNERYKRHFERLKNMA